MTSNKDGNAANIDLMMYPLGAPMKSSHLVCLFCVFLIVLPVVPGLPQAVAQDEASSQKESVSRQAQQVKLIKGPMAPYPNEAFKKRIEGKIVLSIVVDGHGHVSDAKVLSGPAELRQAALVSVKMWEYQPPKSAPVTTTVWMSYGFPKPCPGPISDRGEVSGLGGLGNDKGLLLGPVDSAKENLPYYPEKDRKAGVAGELVLAVIVNRQGEVTRVRVVKSLSPDIDNVVEHTVRTWKYKVMKGNPDDLPSEFTLHLQYQPICDAKF